MARSRQVSNGVGIDSQATVAIIGVIAEKEFEKARTTTREFADYCDYRDYRAMRESPQVGLAMAEVHGTMLYFTLSALLLWREINRKSASDAHDLWVGTMSDVIAE
jgi:hypothetical protein